MSRREVIYISQKPECVEAAIFLKSDALPWIMEYHGVRSLEHVAAIDDADPTTLRQVGLPIAPANAKPGIQTLVRERSGVVTQGETVQGFEESLSIVRDRGIKLYIIDRDGVIWQKKEIKAYGQEFATRLQEMSYNGLPILTVLTASSWDQNREFAKIYGMDERLANGQTYARTHPELLLMENGAVHLDVLTGERRINFTRVDPTFAQEFLGNYRARVLEKVRKEIIPGFELAETLEYDNQDGRVYVAKKETMLTVNIPRSWTARRIDDYRKPEHSGEFREALYDAFAQTADELGMQHQEL